MTDSLIPWNEDKELQRQHGSLVGSRAQKRMVVENQVKFKQDL